MPCVVALLHPRRQHRRAHARLLQPPPLVGHQRDQRAHDHDQPAVRQRRQLVAERLAAARRHHHEAVPARKPSSTASRWPGLNASSPNRLEQLLGRRAMADGRARSSPSPRRYSPAFGRPRLRGPASGAAARGPCGGRRSSARTHAWPPLGGRHRPRLPSLPHHPCPRGRHQRDRAAAVPLAPAPVCWLFARHLSARAR